MRASPDLEELVRPLRNVALQLGIEVRVADG
jgi:hypothetical protein